MFPVLSPPLALAPMAGMTDTAFRRLVKRNGGCGLVVSEMVSSEGLVRGAGRTLEYAEFTEEERPVAIQIFGGDPAKMAEAAQVVERLGADIVDINMGCPVSKISKNSAGCSLMRKPERAAEIVAAMARAVKIPVTVKMRAGWNDQELNAPELAKMVEQAGAAAVTVHGRTAAQAYHGKADWSMVARVARAVRIPVFGSGDLVQPEQVVEALGDTSIAGAFIGRGILINPWLFAQAADLLEGRPTREVSLEERGRFLLEYIDLLLNEGVNEAAGFRHIATGAPSAGRKFENRDVGIERAAEDQALAGDQVAAPEKAASTGRARWVVNKVRALSGWYTRGIDGGSQLRLTINHTDSIAALRELVGEFYAVSAEVR
jgi:tRNA-dihydrouridine synthase B